MPGPHIDFSVYTNEEQLLEGLRRNDPDACACLIKRFASRIYYQVLHIVNDSDEAEGVLQQTFIKACDKLDSFAGRGELGGWISRIATNEALMLLRRRNPQVALATMENLHADDVPQAMHAWPRDPAAQALERELQAQLEQALAGLPKGLLSVFVLRELQGFSTEETANALGLSISATKVRLHRARLRLRESLASYVEVEP